MDRLYEAVAEKGPVCIGLDTSPASLPPSLRSGIPPAEAALAYNKAIIDAASDYAACFKIQIACYEALGLAGLRAYAATLRCLRAKNVLAIADIKRGDIADTAAQYARAHFEGEFEADFVTLSPYMGMDSLEPWLAYADSAGKGAFVLVRTSNKGMRDFEYLELNGGSPPPAPTAGAVSASPPAGGEPPATPPRPQRLYHAVAGKLAELAEARRGRYGYGAFGGVVGCTEPDEAAEIRLSYENLFFLIPGYGAQGGGADTAALLLREGNGGVVNASRSILNAWTKAEGREAYGDDLAFAACAAAEEARAMRDALRRSILEPCR